MSTEIKSSNNDFTTEINELNSLNITKNSFVEVPGKVATYVITLEELNIKSDMLLPEKRAEIKILEGQCELNGVLCTAGDYVESIELASVSFRTRYQQTAKVYIQYVHV